jgi:hypothetical protein
MIRGSSIQRNVQTTRTEGSLISNSFKKLKLEVITKQNSDNSDNCPTVPWTGASYEHSYHIPCRTLLYFEVSTNDALKLKNIGDEHCHLFASFSSILLANCILL